MIPCAENEDQGTHCRGKAGCPSGKIFILMEFQRGKHTVGAVADCRISRACLEFALESHDPLARRQIFL
jgi:hypothetical protein